MTARTPLIPLDDALTELLAQARPLAGVDTVSTFDADGRVLAQAAISPLQVPQQDNSAMDGYALRCADVAAAGVELRVSQRIAAGDSGQPLLPGTAARIFTGAPVPAGADAVVMQEDCEVLEDGRVRVHGVHRPGQHIRRAGEDIARGATVLAAGTRLTPAALGLAASIGLAQLEVARRPRVALFSTGDELAMPGEVPPERMPPGAIYNSNRFFLRAMLQRLGCEVTDLGIVPDRLDATVAKRIIDEQFALRSYEAVVDDWLMPTLVRVGSAWASGTISEAGEHLVANVVMRRLAAAFDAVGPNPPTLPVIVGAPSGISHELGLMSFAVAVRRAGVATIYLGSDIPPAAWADAVTTTSAVMSITAIPRRADARRVTALAERLRADHPGVPLAVGGQFQRLAPPGCRRLGHRIADAARDVARDLAER